MVSRIIEIVSTSYSTRVGTVGRYQVIANREGPLGSLPVSRYSLLYSIRYLFALLSGADAGGVNSNVWIWIWMACSGVEQLGGAVGGNLEAEVKK